MEIANGHNPTPRISPICVFDRWNSSPHSVMSIALMANPKEVAISEIKHAQNRLFLLLSETAVTLLVVVMDQSLEF